MQEILINQNFLVCAPKRVKTEPEVFYKGDGDNVEVPLKIPPHLKCMSAHTESTHHSGVAQGT